MNINFTEKELQVIQLIVPEMTPEETCNKVLRDWYNSNLRSLPTIERSPDQIADEIITASTASVDSISKGGAATLK